MQEEIKEILDYFRTYATIKEVNMIKKLKDYITNLQEKVDQYENPEDYTLFYMWLDEKAKDKMKELQEENESLKKEIENLTHIVANKIIKDYDIDTPLKNQLNEERIKYINLGIVCNDYKSRNEKAIEYNKKNIHSQTLDNILQGVDKE